MQKAGENRDIPWISKIMGSQKELSPLREHATKTAPGIQSRPIWEGRKLGDTLCEVSPTSFGSAFKSIYWCIRQKVHYTGTFIKNVFAHALRDIEASTI